MSTFSLSMYIRNPADLRRHLQPSTHASSYISMHLLLHRDLLHTYISTHAACPHTHTHTRIPPTHKKAMSTFLKMTLPPQVHVLSFVALWSVSLRGTKSRARSNVWVEEMWEL